jgi:hypothetical protein
VGRALASASWGQGPAAAAGRRCRRAALAARRDAWGLLAHLGRAAGDASALPIAIAG